MDFKFARGLGIAGILLVLSVAIVSVQAAGPRNPGPAPMHSVAMQSVILSIGLNHTQDAAFISGLLPNRKNIVAMESELMVMNRGFVRRLANRLGLNAGFSESLKQQMNNYILASNDRSRIGVFIRESRIRELFEKKITANEFINSIWQND